MRHSSHWRYILASILLGAIAIAPSFATATIVIQNNDGPGEGFNDSTVFVPAGGNTATTLGQARLNAFQFAADFWGALLDSGVTIVISAQFDPLPCDATSAVLGSAGAANVSRDFTNAPVANTWYPAALANSLAGADLNPGQPDITATFNADLDNATCLGAVGWYYGLNGAPSGSNIDLVSVLLHEFGHGLGFQTFANIQTGAKLMGRDDAFLRFLERHGASPAGWPAMTDAQRAAAATADPDLHWTGATVLGAAAGIPLTAGFPGGHVQMNAPATLKLGSSVSHFSTALTPDQLMEPSYIGPNHSTGLALPLMQDIGWPTGCGVTCPEDVYLLVDLSGSFNDDLPVFKSQAPVIVSSLRASNSNTRFGLGKFEDYPISPFGDAADGDVAYDRLVDLTFDTSAVLGTVASLFTRDGGDLPQSQLPALYQTATGTGQDLSGAGYPGASIPAGRQASYRNGAKKLVVLWTDASFHHPGDPGNIGYPGPSFAATVAALAAADPIQVIGISSGTDGVADLQAIASATGSLAPAGGVDCDGDGTPDVLQGEPIVCAISATGTGIGQAVVAVVTGATAAEPPRANAGPDRTAECDGSGHATVGLDGGASYDLRGLTVTCHWTSASCSITDAYACATSATCPVGPNTVVLVVNNASADSLPDDAAIDVVDSLAPTGQITAPAPQACFNAASLPVLVQDNIADACDPYPDRTYTPPGDAGAPNAYAAHGDHSVSLKVTDDNLNSLTRSVAFTIDTVAPTVTITQPVADQTGLPPVTTPITFVFNATDNDGATGGIGYEVMKLENCPIYDGRTFGDRDGLLSDEGTGTQLTKYKLCQFMTQCGFTVMYDPKIRIEATDACGNTGSAQRIIRKRLLKTEVCF